MGLAKENEKFNKYFSKYQKGKINEKQFKDKVKKMSIRLFYLGIEEVFTHIEYKI